MKSKGRKQLNHSQRIHRISNNNQPGEQEIHDNLFERWLWRQYDSLKKEYESAEDNKKRTDLLFELAKLLRQYVNCTRTKQGGIQRPYRLNAHSIVEFVQVEMYKAEWSPKVTLISGAVLFARKHTGNLAIEGSALRQPVSGTERKKLESVTRAAQKRFNSSLAKLDAQESDRLDDLRSLSLVDDPAQVDTSSSDGSIHVNSDDPS